MTMNINTEYLNALASVCETAQKIYIPAGYCGSSTTGQSLQSASPYPPTPTFTYSSVENPFPFTMSMEPMNMHWSVGPYFHYSHATPYSQLPPSPAVPPTPPPTPESSPCQAIPVKFHPSHPSNPVTRNVVAHAQFQHYLDETWPEESMRRGSAIIRASLYAKVADALRGEEAQTSRFKHWVKKSEFFLVERMQPGIGYGACLAVPVVKSRGPSKKPAGCKSARQPYKIVARLEDFVYIIGAYHNNQNGHHGIRKTYAMIQEDFSYIPRTAVTKFIELCDICSAHRTKSNAPRQAKTSTGEKTSRRRKTKVEDTTSEILEVTVHSPAIDLPSPFTSPICSPTVETVYQLEETTLPKTIVATKSATKNDLPEDCTSNKENRTENKSL